MIKTLVILAALLFFLPVSSQAQESLEGYVPPPLFGSAPRVIPPEEKPKAAKPKPTQKKIEAKPPAKPLIKPDDKIVIPVKKPLHPKDVFQGTPVETTQDLIPIIEAEHVEPIDLIKKQAVKKPTIKKQTVRNSSGVIKGPKTMPANKKQSVESEVLFEPETQKTPNLLDRVQKKEPESHVDRHVENGVETVTEPSRPPSETALNKAFEVPSFKILPDGSRKLNITFAENQKTLSPEQINALNSLIISTLNGNKNNRLRLESYASPQDSSLTQDRSTALARAMAMRDHLLSKEVAAHRLDIRVLGAQTDIQPMDRVEIYILK